MAQNVSLTTRLDKMGVFVCAPTDAGLREGVRKRVRLGQAQIDPQRRAEIRMQHVWQGVQEAGPPVSKPDCKLTGTLKHGN
uniref:Uncharacterized protein n=1 Tax=Timema monikensis TaxID=170555 RepID=A0A7R9E247_9NEOP|nr:unnamed protein product [Timema monikensis]